MKYWVNTVSKDHVQRGVAGGFTQANHGKNNTLKRAQKGDWLMFYSPKTAYEGGEPLQAFTAIGQITDDEPYQVAMSEDFRPFRRKVEFKKCQEAPIRPLIDQLTFIQDKQKWGYKFRFGMFEVSEDDFQTVATAMHVSLDE